MKRVMLILSLFLLAAGHARAVTPEEVGFDQRLDEPLPLELRFRDDAGELVTLGAYFGERPVALVMVDFDCRNLCSHAMNGLVKSLSAQSFDVGKALTVLAVSLDPTETPAEAEAQRLLSLKRYAREGTEGGWHFLTGDETSIRQLAEALGVRYAYEPESRQYAHPAGLAIATPRGRIARYLFGIEYDPRDLRLAVLDAAENRIGTPIDQVMMRCFRYDPQQGRYTLVVMEVLKLGAFATLLGLSLLIGSLVVVDRRRRSGTSRGRTP